MPKTTVIETTEYIYDSNRNQSYADRKLIKKVKTTVTETTPDFNKGGPVSPNGIYVGDVPYPPNPLFGHGQVTADTQTYTVQNDVAPMRDDA